MASAAAHDDVETWPFPVLVDPRWLAWHPNRARGTANAGQVIGCESLRCVTAPVARHAEKESTFAGEVNVKR
jgi:hypothetical protein